jgi:molybdopterin-containing oxidoreductase family iron-sulfur binding subunit
MKDHLHTSEDQLNLPEEFSRRSFLKLAGFTFAGGVLAGCQQSNLEKAIPHLIKPEELVPGVPLWYASTCAGCSAGCGVLVKTRDGRPIKLEGNPEHPISRGGLCAVGQASLLGLYDSQRLGAPLAHGKESTWEQVDAAIKAELEGIRKRNGAVRFLTGTITSPTTNELVRRFLSTFKDARHVVYDPVSSSALLDAHERTHGVRALPQFRLEKATTIVSLNADFLGTWLSPVEFTKAYRQGRSLQGTPPVFSYHTQFESRLSITGSNADERVSVSPVELAHVASRLLSLLTERAGRRLPVAVPLLDERLERCTTECVERLWRTKGKSLVVCGVNDVAIQVVVNAINEVLGNYGSTIDLNRSSYQAQGNDTDLAKLLDEIRSGNVSALFVDGVNPFYDLPGAQELAAACETIPLPVSFGERNDETAEHMHYVLPQPHELERWNDSEAIAGIVSLTQPTIQPLRPARPLMETISIWMGTKESAYNLIRAEWERSIFKRQTREQSFTQFWNKTLHDGFAIVEPKRQAVSSFNPAAVAESLRQLSTQSLQQKLFVELHASSTILDGRHAHNAWLQELPDPVTKIVWDNVASLSRKRAESLNLHEGDVVRLNREGGRVIELPIHIQQGHQDDVISVSLGYGRKGTDRFHHVNPKWLQAKPTVEKGGTVGTNAAPLLEWKGKTLSYFVSGIEVERTGTNRQIAVTQEYDFLTNPNLLGESSGEKRNIIQQASLATFVANPSAGSFPKPPLDSLWPEEHTYPGHRWGMVIDLTACTGCSACVISCQVENNIPVVGKDEVARNRELQWLRIDRYYEEEGETLRVAHQPMLCQHCGNAPCETVCPVLATVHNSEGLNQQVYNRCVGTRYCANNCPYKVRHFNWFQYPRGDEIARMVLNPDVTVRDRGVMEKCTFCVQRIQLAKIEAKNEGRALRDGDVKSACQQSCPADAIIFGDVNDPNSEVSRKMKDPRTYRVLEELGVRPSIGYMTLVRNSDGIAVAEGGMKNG